MGTAVPELSRAHAERIRRIAFAEHPEWYKGWVVQAQHRLARDIELAGLQERLRYLYHQHQHSKVAEADPFEVFVVGEVKFGKSTLINALLGVEIAPTDFVPKTWCFNRYIAVEKPEPGVIVLADPASLGHEADLKALLGPQRAEIRGLGEFRVSREDANRILDLEEQKTLAALASPTPYVSPVLEMEWQVESTKGILPGIRLVDTMGINGMRERKGHLRYLTWQYARADCVLWVVSAKNLNSAGTREELESCRRYAKRVILVVNRWDEVEDRERLAETARELYSEFATEIVFLSALAASVGVTETPIESLPAKQRGPLAAFMNREGIHDHQGLLERSGYASLRSILRGQLDGQLDLVRNEAAYNALRRQEKEFQSMARQARDDVRHNLETLQMLLRSLEETDAECQAAIQERCEEIRGQLERRLRTALTSLDYGDADSPESKVSLEAIVNLARVEQQKLVDELEVRYRDLITRLADSTNYVQSEFSADGKVAETLHLRCVGAVSLDLAPLEMEALLEGAGKGLLLRAYDMVENVPVLGTLAVKLAGNVAERKRTEVLDDLRRKLKQEIEPRIGDLVETLAAHMQSNRVRTSGHIEVEILQHAEPLGTMACQRARAEELDEIVRRPAPAPFWAAVTLQALRGRRWVRA